MCMCQYVHVCVSVFEVGWCECGWLVLWGAGFSVFNSKWEMNSVFELGECFFEVGECECGWLVLWSAGFSVFNSKWEMNSVLKQVSVSVNGQCLECRFCGFLPQVENDVCF